MANFMDRDYLLDTSTAKILFHEHAEKCPIIDYHNHLCAKDIAEHRQYDNLAQIWLECDHYKWRAMRACGIDERLITGKDSTDYEKFLAWASCMPKLIGCPLYTWTHFELQRYFGITEPFNPVTAPAIWEKTTELLRTKEFNAVSLLQKQNVRALCTTDDPADCLQWHKAIREDASIPFRVLPSFRPDRFLGIGSAAFLPACEALGRRYQLRIDSFAALKTALTAALDFFCSLDCHVSDHGFIDFTYTAGGTDEEAETVFAKALAGQPISVTETAIFRSVLLRFLAGAYQARGIVMQLHLGALRNSNPILFDTLGPDAGGDSIGSTTTPSVLSQFLHDLALAHALPKTILYNLNPAENEMLATLAGCFAPAVCYGAAWWFNDTYRGIRRQLEDLMDTAQLAGSVGMLTDSRSLTSFPRHEFYRRILCQVLGEKVASGMYPDDTEALGQLVEDVCFRNATRFFQL